MRLPMVESELRKRLEKYSFYHTIKLTDQVSTPGWQAIGPVVEMTLKALRTLKLEEKRVLDIGCRDGLCCFEAERLGASEVIGIDNDLSTGAVELLIPFLRSRVRMLEMNLYDLTPQLMGCFDVIIFSGVLYHLRYPFWALKRISEMLNPGGHLIIETAILVDENQHAMLYCPIGSDSPLEPTSCTFFNVKGLTDTLHSLGVTVEKVDFFNNIHLRIKEPKPRLPRRLYQAFRNAVRGSETDHPRPCYTDRATFLCRRIPQVIDPEVSRYWHETHRIHTGRQGRIYN